MEKKKVIYKDFEISCHFNLKYAEGICWAYFENFNSKKFRFVLQQTFFINLGFGVKSSHKLFNLCALPGGHTFFLKKKYQKKQFLCNDPLKNFAFGTLRPKKNGRDEILQRTTQKN